jgi:serine/threonine protein kinase
MSNFTTEPSGPILELGGFRLLSILGEGSFATAYLAQQIGTERKAVLKVAHTHLIRGPYGEMIRQRFDAEVRAITRIQHPNMVTVYTSGLTDGGVPYIAMEFINGHTLDERLQRAAPLTRATVLVIFEQVASVLKSAHALGVVHRDITPNNIMLQDGPAGEPIARVLDFGIAMLDEKHTHTVGPIGTPRYLAPEQLNGRAVAQSDIFSLGAVLWWALTGHEYLEEASSIFDIFRIYNYEGVPNNPHKLRKDIDPELARLVTSMLQAKPEDRPDAATLHQHLLRLRNAETTQSLIRPLTPIADLPRADIARPQPSTSALGLGLESSEPQDNAQGLSLLNAQILHLMPESAASELLQRQLERAGAELIPVESAQQALDAMEQFVPDVLLLKGPKAQLTMHELAERARKLNPAPLVVLITDRIPTGALPDHLIVITTRDATTHIISLLDRYLNKPERLLRKKLTNTTGLDLGRINTLYTNHPDWLERALDQVVEHVPKLLARIEESLDRHNLIAARAASEQLERACREVGLVSLAERCAELLSEIVPMRTHIARDRHAKAIAAYMAVFPTILQLRALLAKTPRAKV